MAGSSLLFHSTKYISLVLVCIQSSTRKELRPCMLKVPPILWIFLKCDFLFSQMFFPSFAGLTYTIMQNLVNYVN